MDACTIIARNYLAHARVLAESFLRAHPDGTFTVLLLDDPSGAAAVEPFEVISPYEIGIERTELHRMAMIYDVMELATAVKPSLLRTLLERGATDITYFDPDIEVFAPLDDVAELAREHSIVLIPHLTEPIPDDGLLPSETTILEAGVYNLGFISVAHGARAFLDWWSARLARECVLAPERARFVDQRWADFVPAMFDHFILRDRGCDVAHWNVWNREVTWQEDGYRVDGVPLRFYHFSGFDPERPALISKHQGALPRVSLEDEPALRRLYGEYAEKLLGHGYREASRTSYGFGRLPSGIEISRELRQMYRTALLAAEEAADEPPPDPFEPGEAVRFASWFDELVGGQRGRLEPSAPPGVNLAGYLSAELGIGEAARHILAAFERAEVPLAAVSYREATQSRQDHPEPVGSSDPVFDTNVVCVNADGMPRFYETVGPEFFAGRYTIGVWWWEVSVFPPEMHRGLPFVDEVWVGSEYARQAIAPHTTKPVTKIVMPVDVPEVVPLSRAELGLPEEFLFLFTYDFFSVLERKNPLGLIDAFTRAFRPGEGAKLVLKSINGDKCDRELARVRAAAASHPDVIVLDQYVTAAEKNAMAASCDCYVSLHRSEGFGLTLAEAMAYERPVIATAYSGNLEFMTPDNSYLVPYRAAQVPPGAEPYPVGAEWAEPDLDAAAEAMRRVYEDREEAAERGRRARRDILSRHDPETAGAFIRTRLEEARRTRPPLLASDLLSLHRGGSRFGPIAPLLDELRRFGEVPNALGAAPPGRSGGLGTFVRRLLLRAMWPYVRRQHELTVTLVRAVEALDAACVSQAAELGALKAALRSPAARRGTGPAGLPRSSAEGSAPEAGPPEPREAATRQPATRP